MESSNISEMCVKCAECCKSYPSVELSKNEIYSLEQVTGLHFDNFTNTKGKAVVKGYFLQSQENGDCVFLDKDNGVYSCKVYEARPRICQDYPSEPRQIEFCDANRKNSE